MHEMNPAVYALNLGQDGRILSATYPQYAPEDAVLMDVLPEGDIADYRYVEGEYVYDPLPPSPEPEPEESVWDELETAYQEGVNSI